MQLNELYPCLGVKLLGLCAYNPAHPYIVYFTVGDAIAALGFTLAIQQLFKPIYLFRVRAYGLKIIYLPIAVFAGALCSAVAMLLPNWSISHSSALTYPIAWELIGCTLIATAYFIVAIISFLPARIYRFNLKAFTGAAARLLSSATDDDRAIFADDLLHGDNLERLIAYASAWEKAEMDGATVEFERLRAIGAPAQITGPPPISAFYLFSHREALSAATTAGTFLQIVSDPEFCSVLARKCSWITAEAINRLADKRLHVDQANAFIQEISRQAILSEDSMLAKETDYKGFGSFPVLSHSLFGDPFILRNYDPLNAVGFSNTRQLSPGYISRLNKAANMMLATAIKGQEYWACSYMWSVERAYENISREWSFSRPAKLSVDIEVSLNMGIRQLYSGLNEGLKALHPDRKRGLFITDPKAFRNDLVDTIAKTVFDSLESISNTFKGYDDDAWFHAIQVFTDIFPPFDTTPLGMNPLQQQLGLLLLRKLDDNMNGFYPAISRVLLAVVGPYNRNTSHANRTAFNIFKDAMYKALQKLPDLSARKPDKISTYFPDNVSYDRTTNTLTHTYRLGSAEQTDLSALNIPEIDLTNTSNWDIPNSPAATS